VHTYDETNRRVRPARIIRDISRAGGKALVALVGVQTNQFPRAVDLARRFRAVGWPVAMGGFHIAGCLAMLPEMPPEMRDAQALGIAFFAGEAEEGRFDTVIRDAWSGSLAPLYNFVDDLPSLQRTATDPAAQARASYIRVAVQHRSRARLSLPVLLLHHYHRTGA